MRYSQVWYFTPHCTCQHLAIRFYYKEFTLLMPGICCYELVCWTPFLAQNIAYDLGTNYKLSASLLVARRFLNEHLSTKCTFFICPQISFSHFKNTVLQAKHLHALDAMQTAHFSDHCLLHPVERSAEGPFQSPLHGYFFPQSPQRERALT